MAKTKDSNADVIARLEALEQENKRLAEQVTAQNTKAAIAGGERLARHIPDEEVDALVNKAPCATTFYMIVERPKNYHNGMPLPMQGRSVIPDNNAYNERTGVSDPIHGVDMVFGIAEHLPGNDLVGHDGKRLYRVLRADLTESEGLRVTKEDVAKYNIVNPDDCPDKKALQEAIDAKIREDAPHSIGGEDGVLEVIRRRMRGDLYDPDTMDSPNLKIMPEHVYQAWVDGIYTEHRVARERKRKTQEGIKKASRADIARGAVGVEPEMAGV